LAAQQPGWPRGGFGGRAAMASHHPKPESGGSIDQLKLFVIPHSLSIFPSPAPNGAMICAPDSARRSQISE